MKNWKMKLKSADADVVTVSSTSVSTGSNADELDYDADIMPLASYGDVYDGTISSTVTNYMKGIVCRFSPSIHYVLFRDSQYSYRLVYGKDLTVDGSMYCI